MELSIINDKMPVVELLAGLAEEASELAQAALKLRRVFDGTNPTPTHEDEAISNLYEEIADVNLYVDNLYINPSLVDEIKQKKLHRWEGRLMKRE